MKALVRQIIVLALLPVVLVNTGCFLVIATTTALVVSRRSADQHNITVQLAKPADDVYQAILDEIVLEDGLKVRKQKPKTHMVVAVKRAGLKATKVTCWATTLDDEDESSLALVVSTPEDGDRDLGLRLATRICKRLGVDYKLIE